MIKLVADILFSYILSAIENFIPLFSLLLYVFKFIKNMYQIFDDNKKLTNYDNYKKRIKTKLY